MLYILDYENHGVMQLHKENQCEVWVLQVILRGEKNLSHGDSSHFMV